MEPRAPSLDQVTVFLAIVETGSFTAAARKLGRAVSVISFVSMDFLESLGNETV